MENQVKSYSNLSNAKRAAKAQGLVIENVNFVKLEDGRFTFEAQVMETPVEAKPMASHYAPVKAIVFTSAQNQCGLSHCPHCGIDLENGLAHYNDMCETNRQAAGEMEKEWVCLGCNGEFGEKIQRKPKSRATGTGLKIEPNRVEQNGVIAPSKGGKCAQVWAQCEVIWNGGKGPVPTPKVMKAWAKENDFSEVTAVVQLYRWREHKGFKGRK